MAKFPDMKTFPVPDITAPGGGEPIEFSMSVTPDKTKFIFPARMLQRLFPLHQAGLILEHNPHITVSDSVEHYMAPDYMAETWVSEQERETAIATGELWRLTWYPDTPVGQRCVSASSLEAVLQVAQESEA